MRFRRWLCSLLTCAALTTILQAALIANMCSQSAREDKDKVISVHVDRATVNLPLLRRFLNVSLSRGNTGSFSDRAQRRRHRKQDDYRHARADRELQNAPLSDHSDPLLASRQESAVNICPPAHHQQANMQRPSSSRNSSGDDASPLQVGHGVAHNAHRVSPNELQNSLLTQLSPPKYNPNSIAGVPVKRKSGNKARTHASHEHLQGSSVSHSRNTTSSNSTFNTEHGSFEMEMIGSNDTHNQHRNCLQSRSRQPHSTINQLDSASYQETSSSLINEQDGHAHIPKYTLQSPHTYSSSHVQRSVCSCCDKCTTTNSNALDHMFHSADGNARLSRSVAKTNSGHASGPQSCRHTFTQATGMQWRRRMTQPFETPESCKYFANVVSAEYVVSEGVETIKFDIAAPHGAMSISRYVNLIVALKVFFDSMESMLEIATAVKEAIIHAEEYLRRFNLGMTKLDPEYIFIDTIAMHVIIFPFSLLEDTSKPKSQVADAVVLVAQMFARRSRNKSNYPLIPDIDEFVAAPLPSRSNKHNRANLEDSNCAFSPVTTQRSSSASDVTMPNTPQTHTLSKSLQSIEQTALPNSFIVYKTPESFNTSQEANAHLQKKKEEHQRHSYSVISPNRQKVMAQLDSISVQSMDGMADIPVKSTVERRRIYAIPDLNVPVIIAKSEIILSYGRRVTWGEKHFIGKWYLCTPIGSIIDDVLGLTDRMLLAYRTRMVLEPHFFKFLSSMQTQITSMDHTSATHVPLLIIIERSAKKEVIVTTVLGINSNAYETLAMVMASGAKIDVPRIATEVLLLIELLHDENFAHGLITAHTLMRKRGSNGSFLFPQYSVAASDTVSKSGDISDFGILLAVLSGGQWLRDSSEYSSTGRLYVLRVPNGQEMFLQMPSGVHEDVQNLCDQCFIEPATQRPQYSDLLQHPYIKPHVPDRDSHCRASTFPFGLFGGTFTNITPQRVYEIIEVNPEGLSGLKGAVVANSRTVDSVVQQVVIVEQTWPDRSHSMRRNTSCHSFEEHRKVMQNVLERLSYTISGAIRYTELPKEARESGAIALQCRPHLRILTENGCGSVWIVHPGPAKTLHAILENKSTVIPDPPGNIIKDILLGLKVLHDNEIMHLGLGPGSILRYWNGKYAIANLASTCRPDEDEQIVLRSGHLETSFNRGVLPITKYIQAPELIYNNLSFKTDIFSLGMITAEVLRHTIIKPEQPLINDARAHRDHEVVFIKACTLPDPNARPTVDELLVFPFIRWLNNAETLSNLVYQVTPQRWYADDIRTVETTFDYLTGTAVSLYRYHLTPENEQRARQILLAIAFRLPIENPATLQRIYRAHLQQDRTLIVVAEREYPRLVCPSNVPTERIYTVRQALRYTLDTLHHRNLAHGGVSPDAIRQGPGDSVQLSMPNFTAADATPERDIEALNAMFEPATTKSSSTCAIQ